MKVVLIRHGESEANFENYWTGWLDVALTAKGREQAWQAGEKIKELGISFDVAFASYLQRTIITCNTVLEASAQLWVPTYKTWRLNERHYGQLVGVNKDEMVARYGKGQVQKWRRGYNEPPLYVSENHFDRRYDDLDPRLITKARKLLPWPVIKTFFPDRMKGTTSMSPMQSQSFIPLIHKLFYKNGWDKDEHYY